MVSVSEPKSGFKNPHVVLPATMLFFLIHSNFSGSILLNVSSGAAGMKTSSVGSTGGGGVGGGDGLNVGGWVETGVVVGGGDGLNVGGWVETGVVVGGGDGLNVGGWVETGVVAGMFLLLFDNLRMPVPSFIPANGLESGSNKSRPSTKTDDASSFDKWIRTPSCSWAETARPNLPPPSLPHDEDDKAVMIKKLTANCVKIMVVWSSKRKVLVM